ncbi:MAG: YbgA family protein [Planctomycetota bacterium]|jgi:uncharacterized protein YbgA (DUF1722 family)/uncharacterized protein YbbK (DUF523 family)
MNNEDFAKPRVGISSCLLGEQVRYDGGHKRDRFLTDTFGRFVEWVPVCPEVECGLPTPRESMHLEGNPTSPRLVTTRTHVDQTERMLRWARQRLDELESLDLCGFIFKTNSPSSGMRGIRVYDENGVPHKVGVGLFAGAFMSRFPLIPVEDEGRLHDAGIRENFIERLFALKRYRDAARDVGSLVSFHAEHKMQLMAHSQKHLSEMGRLVAHAKEMPRDELFATYEDSLMLALRERATPRKNVNVLMHMMGFFKEALTADEKAEMLEIIRQYGDGLVPLIVSVTLMSHYVRKYDQPYLRTQTYLHPHPAELKLRNHA